MATANIYDLADTWDDVNTTFTAIKMDVTDTASDAASLLMDLQVGGASKFSIAKDGDITFGSHELRYVNSATADLALNNSTVARFSTAGIALGGASIPIAVGTSGSTNDTLIYRDAADTLALRRSTNAQAFNVYNTYTDASNYERGVIKFNSNTLEIGTEAAGTGTNRGVRIKSGGTVIVENHLSPPSSVWSLGATTSWNNLFLNNHIIQGGYHQLTEMTAPSAPSTNVVRIYAEDNGSGKTQLMALFATGAAQQIAIEP